MKIKKIDALIAAYNEEKTIKSVINVLLKTPEINNIIIVDDGSFDKTYQIVSQIKTKKIVLLKMPKNGGKSQAVAFGLKKVTTNNVFLCDADLVKLTPQICSSIIKPVIQNKYGMSVGFRNYGVTPYVFSKLFPPISGERAISTDILKRCTKSKFFYNYGMETIINYYCQHHNIKVISNLYDYGHINHITKDSLFKGLKLYFNQLCLIGKIHLSILIKGWH